MSVIVHCNYVVCYITSEVETLPRTKEIEAVMVFSFDYIIPIKKGFIYVERLGSEIFFAISFL